jgi:hypothetical protein
MDNEVIVVNQADMLEAINRSEVDLQIATAKQYPRDLNRVLNQIETYATMDKETAEDCFYCLKRKDADGKEQDIEGLSVRMAEIIASAWGNLRVATRIIGNDGSMITAQAVCHDLETNVAVSKEVKRSIRTKKGYTFSQDMQVVTGNAASSIAFRNAVLAVIPKAVTKKIISNVKRVAMGTDLDVETSRVKILEYFGKLGVSEEQLFFYLDIKKVDEIDKEMIFRLRGTVNAIKEGTTTVEETFFKPMQEAVAQAAAEKEAKTAEDKAAQAIAKATGTVPQQPKQKKQPKQDAPKNVDPQTGEIFNQENNQ